MSNKPLKWIAAVLTLALVAGACSNKDSGTKSPANQGSGNGEASTAGGSMFPEDILNKAVHEGTPKQGGTITFGLESDVLDLSPNQNMIQPADVQLGSAVYDSLINFGDRGDFDGVPVTDNTDHQVNQIAEKLEGSENLKTWTLTLRDDVKFANGKPVNADAVVAHTNWVISDPASCSCESDAKNIESIEKTGEYTVVYHLKEGNVAFAGALNRGGLGWIIDQEEAANAADPSNPGWENLIGAGPFKFQSKSGDSYTLVKNEEYYGVDPDNDDAKLPYLDKLVFRPLADSVTRLQAVQSGSVQIMQTADTSNLEGAKKDKSLNIQPAEGSSATILVLNLTHEPFGVEPADGEDLQDTASRGIVDPDALKARQAFNYSIDRVEINQKYYKGTRTPAYSFVPKALTAWYDDNPDAQLPRHDAEKAKELISELKAKGRETDVSALCINTPEASGIFALLKEQATEVGVNAKLEQVEQSKLVDILLAGSDDTKWDSACFRSPQIWDPNGVYNALKTGGTTNLPKYSNADVDKWLDEARETADHAKRKELYDNIQVQVAHDVVYVPLLFDLYGNVFRDDVSGLSTPSPSSLGVIAPGGLYYIDD